MTRQKFILALLIAIVIGFSNQQIFSQKTTKIGKRGKMITFPKPPPKQLYMEATIKGNGTYDCGPVKTCTWKVDRKYSGTIIFHEFTKMPFAAGTSPPGTASAIAEAKVAAKAKANPAAAYDSMWHNLVPGQTMFFDVKVVINDENKQSWSQEVTRNNKRTTEEVTITETWTADITGNGFSFRGCYIKLDRQTRRYITLCGLDSDAEMIHKTENKQGEKVTQKSNTIMVPRVPEIEGNIPIEGVTPNDETASFEKTFPNAKFNSGEGTVLDMPGIKDYTITVTYKFK